MYGKGREMRWWVKVGQSLNLPHYSCTYFLSSVLWLSEIAKVSDVHGPD